MFFIGSKSESGTEQQEKETTTTNESGTEQQQKETTTTNEKGTEEQQKETTGITPVETTPSVKIPIKPGWFLLNSLDNVN